MNKQEIFDKVALHLLTQNERSEYGGYCKYLNHDDLKCAVGCLIPDGHPGQLVDGGVGELIRKYQDLEAILPTDINDVDAKINFMREMQNIHDIADLEMWAESLCAFADQWGLSSDVITNFQKAKYE